MAWIILMFTAFNSAARPMKEDLASVEHTYIGLGLHVLIVARTLHQSLIMSALSSLVLAMGLFLGSLDISSMLAFSLGLLITGSSRVYTFVSAISARAGAGYGLTAVLGLP